MSLPVLVGEDGAIVRIGASSGVLPLTVLDGKVAGGSGVLVPVPGMSGGAGQDGSDGASAYEVAVANGFVGGEAAWLASLQGEDGADGDDGGDGMSAYEVAVQQGFVGDETAWLASLVGADGEDGSDGAPGTTDYNELDNLPTLGTAASADADDFATAAQGALADSAVQPEDWISKDHQHVTLTNTSFPGKGIQFRVPGDQPDGIQNHTLPSTGGTLVSENDLGTAAAEDVEAFVPRSTSASQKVYGTSSTGAQATYSISQSPGSNTIARRESGSGALAVGDPEDADHATPKSYVDGAVGALADVASTGDYEDLIGKPDFDWPTIADKPTWALTGSSIQNFLSHLKVSPVRGGVADGNFGFKWGSFNFNAIYTHPESSEFSPIPHLFNDIAYNNIRGGSVMVEKNGGVLYADGNHLAEVFTPDATYANIPITTAATDEIVITVTLHRTFYYGTKIGIFQTEWCRARRVTVEQFDGTEWAAAGYLGAEFESPTGLTWSPGDASVAGITKLRFTLSDFNCGDASNIRITQIMLLGYDSALLSGPFLPRGGGELYGGHISDAADPTSADHLARKAYADGLVAHQVSGSDNGTPTALTLWTGTEAEYDAVDPKDADTIYLWTD